MDKIKYILAINNIKMTDGAKNRISGALSSLDAKAKEQTKAKKRKNIRVTVLAVLLSALMLAGVVFGAVMLIKAKINAPHTPALTDTEYYPPDVTTEHPGDQTPEYGYYTVNPQYEYNDSYNIFRDALSVIKIGGDGGVAVNTDVSSLYPYFGGEITCYDLCRTVTSFCCDINMIRPTNPSQILIQSMLPTEAQSALGTSYILEQSGKEERELIALTARDGTFEYLLTFTVYVEKVKPYSSTVSWERKLYNFGGEAVGFLEGESTYRIKKEAFDTLTASVYKIRFERGIPVIYQQRAIDIKSYGIHEGVVVSDRGVMDEGFVINDNGRNLNVLTGASFILDAETVVIFSNAEQDMTSAVNAGAGGVFGDYPYTVQTHGNDNTDLSKNTVTKIINALQLQWFIPMYSVRDESGLHVTGAGITVGNSVGKAGGFRIIGMNNTPSFAAYSGGGYNVSLYYNGTVSDRPYFTEIDFMNLLPLTEVTVSYSGEITSVRVIRDPVKQFSDHGMIGSDLPDTILDFDMFYVVDKNKEAYSPTTPFSAWLMPYLTKQEQTAQENELLQLLGVRITPTEQITLADQTTGQKKESPYYTEWRSMKLTGVNSGELRKIGGKTYKYDHADVYSQEGNYIADALGVICGYTENGRAYYFNTYTPAFGIVVLSCDGEFMYIGCGEDIGVGRMTQTHYSFEETDCGLMLGSLLASLSSESNIVYSPITDVKFSEDNYIMLEFYFTMSYPKSGRYPVTQNGCATYRFDYADMAVSNTGLVFWEFSPDVANSEKYVRVVRCDGKTLYVTDDIFRYYSETDEIKYE